jgi:putative transcriptional regulator
MTEDKNLRGLKEALAFTKGELQGARVYKVKVERIDVRAVRQHLGLTQQAFARDFGFSLSAVRHWEQGKRHPEKSAEILLRLIATHPDLVREHARLPDAAE